MNKEYIKYWCKNCKRIVDTELKLMHCCNHNLQKLKKEVENK